jgi:glycosyltransferase involved in cell wall biosynthesis
MKCVFLHQSIIPHDAIGNDIAHMYRILERKHDVFVYCNILMNKTLKSLNRNALLDFISNEDNLIIYHHSNYWEEGEEILRGAKAKVIFKYHCITPASFFKNCCDDYYFLCKRGCDQTRILFKEHDTALWMGDSYFNFAEAGLAGFSNAVIIPPFNNLEQWKNVAPDEALLKSLLESPTINLLFVGRMVPNKGHRMLIEIMRDYVSHYDKNIAIYIVGRNDDRLYAYNKALEELIESYGLKSRVFWVREVNDSTLLSYYLGCDFYLNCSDHEGFCVPIVEAQSLCLHVIAKHAGAVPETIGREQVVLNDDPAEYSAAIRILSQNDPYRDYVVKMGLENYKSRFTNEIIERKFVKAVEEYVGVAL